MRHLMLMSLILIVSCGGEEPEVKRRQSTPSKPRVTLAKPHVEPGKVHVQPTALPKPKGLHLTLETYPRTSGSTSAEPLGVWVACRLLGKECLWPASLGGERRLMLSELFRDAGRRRAGKTEKKRPSFYDRIRHGGTHGSYKKLIAGKTDLIYECRRPSEDERKLMQSKKVELDIRPVALDAFVFIRNKDNPVKGLTLAQVKDIYTRGADGKAKMGNWKQVGGPDARIQPYVRNRNSGSQETMKTLVMKERAIVKGQRTRRSTMMFGTMSGPYNFLHDNKTGIGFTFFYYQRHMAPMLVGGRGLITVDVQELELEGARTAGKKAAQPLVQMFAIDGVMPSRATIADGTYPLVTEVYVVTRKDLKPDHPAAKLRDWLLTAEGQGVVGETGYVPIAAKKK